MPKSLNPFERFAGIDPKERTFVDQIDRLTAEPKPAQVFDPFSARIQAIGVNEFCVFVHNKLLALFSNDPNPFGENRLFLHGGSL